MREKKKNRKVRQIDVRLDQRVANRDLVGHPRKRSTWDTKRTG